MVPGALRAPPPVYVLASPLRAPHWDWIEESTIKLPLMGISPMEACAIMGHWSARPSSEDPCGLPRLHLLPADDPQDLTRLILGLRSDPFVLPFELRGRSRDSFPASFFRRSPLTATACEAATSLYLSLRNVEHPLPLGLHLMRLMTAISGVIVSPPAFPEVVRERHSAERGIRALAHRAARLFAAGPARAPTLHEALHEALHLRDADFDALVGSPADPSDPLPYEDGHSDPGSESDEVLLTLALADVAVNQVLSALFRTEVGLEEALAEPRPFAGHARLARLERLVTLLTAWVRSSADLAQRALTDPA